MKSNRLAVFAASLQCTDEVKVVPRVSDDWCLPQKEKGKGAQAQAADHLYGANKA